MSLFYHSLPFLLYIKKESCLQDSPPAAGRICDMIQLRRSAIPAKRFCVIGTKFPITQERSAQKCICTLGHFLFSFYGSAILSKIPVMCAIVTP